jgi:hypothetical protein
MKKKREKKKKEGQTTYRRPSVPKAVRSPSPGPLGFSPDPGQDPGKRMGFPRPGSSCSLGLCPPRQSPIQSPAGGREGPTQLLPCLIQAQLPVVPSGLGRLSCTPTRLVSSLGGHQGPTEYFLLLSSRPGVSVPHGSSPHPHIRTPQFLYEDHSAQEFRIAVPLPCPPGACHLQVSTWLS